MRQPRLSWCGRRIPITESCIRPDGRSPPQLPVRRLKALGDSYSGLVRRGEQNAVFVATDGGFASSRRLLAEDQDHVVVSGPISDKDGVAIGGISALRGILSGLGQ